MSDLISRHAAIRLTYEEPAYYDPINVLTELREKIKALPSAEPKEEDVKCSYRQSCGWCSLFDSPCIRETEDE